MHETQAIPKARRVRTLALSLSAVLIGATFYAHNVRADEGCGAQRDFLVKGDRLMATVRPMDCARLYEAAADFAWPEAHAGAFVVTLTHPDGHVTAMHTETNWLASEPLPPGEYTWTVTAIGSQAGTSAKRRFTIDAHTNGGKRS